MVAYAAVSRMYLALRPKLLILIMRRAPSDGVAIHPCELNSDPPHITFQERRYVLQSCLSRGHLCYVNRSMQCDLWVHMYPPRIIFNAHLKRRFIEPVCVLIALTDGFLGRNSDMLQDPTEDIYGWVSSTLFRDTFC
jgi:hypothetical protein